LGCTAKKVQDFDENIAAPIDKLAWLWANAAQRDHAALQL